MSTTRTVAFWLFVYLSISPVLSSVLVISGLTPPFPVFQIFENAPLIWRTAFVLSGLLAVLTAYLIHSKSKIAALTAFAFLVLYGPSFRVVWGQISVGILIAVSATALTIFVALKARNEV